MQFLKDIFSFIQSFSELDYLLYFAVLVLIILVVSLIHIIKNGEDEIEETKESNDLKEIANHLETKKPLEVELTDYEMEQEEKAIISYDELLEKSKQGNILYDEEKKSDDLSIKKINLDALTEERKEEKQVGFSNYEREEEFLKTLKALNQLLN